MSRSRQNACRTAFALVLFLSCVLSTASAQQAATGAIRGTVRDADSNSPVGRALVTLEGRNIGILTNEDGRFQLPNLSPGNYTVKVEILGYTTERRENVAVVAGETAVADFTLRTRVLSMAEIVVTGVTEATSRAKLPFTVARVNADAIPVAPKVAVAAIQGKVAGVTLVQGAQPGDGASIQLRTPTSINRTNSPLIVVDGTILTESSTDISSLDIESIEVVKGAAAASLYGSRAAAGVIQIRTARGSQIQEGRTRFTVQSEYGTNSIMKPIEWSKFHNLRLTNDGSAFGDSLGRPVERKDAVATPFLFQDQQYPGPTYDHIDAFFDPGRFITNSFSLGYNSGNTSWLSRASQHHTTGVVLGNDGYRRYDFRTNLDHRVRNDLSASLSVSHMRSKQEDLAGNPFFDFIHQSPDVNLRQPDPDGTKYAFQPDPIGIRASPLYQIATQDHWNHRARTLGSVDLRYNPIDWLAATINGSYDRSDRSSEDFVPRGVKTPENPNGGIGSVSRSSSLTTGINMSAGLTASRTFFGNLQARSAARVLIEREDNESISANADDAAVGGLNDLDAFNTLGNGSSESAIRSRGYYLTADLDYADRYIFSGLVRRDGSSLFGSEERWHNYYRASGAYRITAEPWWPEGSPINELKLHYSRGTAGGRPNFADRFEVFGLGSSGLTLQTLGNVFLKPERTTEQELGIDVVALERYSLTLAHARQRTVDELVTVPLPAIYGFGSQWQNAGTIEGKTWEATLEARLLDRDNLRWTVTMIADRSRNEIVEYNRPCHSDGIGNRCAGAVLGEMWGNALWRGFDDLPTVHANSREAFQLNDDGLLVPVGVGRSFRDGTTGCTDVAPLTRVGCWGKTINIDGVNYAWGMPRRVLDASGNPARVAIGDANPDANWGISSQLRWHGLTAYALIGGQIGGDVYNATKQRMYQYTRNREIDQDDKAEELKKPTTYYTGPLYNADSTIDWFVEDASYTKLREASLRYAVPVRKLPGVNRIGARNVWLSVVGRNLFVITGYSGYDPEIGNVLTRTDSFDFPTYRTFTFSIDIEF
jgi:TonB-linked SusC/RagA family outer membrane protein